MGKRVAHHLRLLVNFLRHKVAVIAFVDEKRRGRGSEYGTRDLAAFGVADFDALACKNRPIAFLEVGDRVGKGCECHCIGAEIHFPVSVADGKRRALAGAYNEIVLSRKQKRECERAAQPRQRGRHRLGGRVAILHLLRHEMGNDLSVGIGAELRPRPLQLLTQLTKILDDSIVNNREALGRMRMGIILGRSAVCRPAGVADTDRARERLAS